MVNRALGIFSHMKLDENDAVRRIWLIFHNKKTGTIATRKSVAYVTEKNIDKTATPVQLLLRSTTIQLNRNKTVYMRIFH